MISGITEVLKLYYLFLNQKMAPNYDDSSSDSDTEEYIIDQTKVNIVIFIFILTY